MRAFGKPLILSLVFSWALLGSDPHAAPSLRRGGEGLPPGYRLPIVEVGGKAYYRTFRVTSADGAKRISDTTNTFRWFQGSGQYGDGFYLFRTLKAAKLFAKAELARGAKRDVILEVLLPRDRFDQISKHEVSRELDWERSPAALRELRLSNHLLFGRWAESPYADEPVYRPLIGAKQFSVVQRGMPSILHDALLRRVRTR